MKRAILLIPAIVAVVLSLWFWQGLRGTDDMGYAQVAMSDLQGDATPPLYYRPDFHDGRLGVIGPLIAIFWLFGPSNVSMALLPLLCTMLTASLVTWLGRRYWGDACGLTAGLLYAMLPLTISLSTFYTPEPMATFEMCLATVLVVMAADRKEHSGLLKFAAGLVIGIAYLTTEVGALMLPALYLALWVKDGRRPRDAWMLAGFAAVLGSELIYHAAVHGNPLHRFALAQGYADDPMVGGANSGDLTYRLFKAYPALFVYPGLDFGALGSIMVLGGLYGLFRWRERSLFLVWAAVILLFYNFMSGSLSSYVLTPVDARHVGPACVPLLILTAKLCVDTWNWARRTSAAVVRLGIPALLAGSATALAAASIVAMYGNTVPTLDGAIARNGELVADFLREYPAVTVVSDRVSARTIQFYRGYNPRDAFYRFEAGVSTSAPGAWADTTKPAFVVLDGPVLYEEEVAGHVYGGGLSLSEADRQAVDVLVPPGQAEVFAGHFTTGSLVKRLMQYNLVRRMVGPYKHRLGTKLIGDDTRLGQTRVFRYPRQP